MRKYKSAIYKHLHGEFKDMFEAGAITVEELKEFEQRCFKPETPQGRASCSSKPQTAKWDDHKQKVGSHTSV